MTAGSTTAGTTPDAPQELVLAGEFDAAGRDQWRELVSGVLRKAGREVDAGTDVEDLISTATADGFAIRPLYTAEDAPDAPAGVPGLPPFTRGARPEGRVAEGWGVRQRVVLPVDADPSAAHDALLAELENGVSSLWLVLGDAGGPSVDALPALLEGVFLDLAPVALDAGRDTPDAAATLLRLAEQAGAGAIAGSLGFDPLLARTRGGAPLEASYLEAMAELSRRAVAGHPALRTVVADGVAFHAAGASDAQQLGAALAAGLSAVRRLVAGPGDAGTGDSGLDVDAAFARVEFRLAASADQFATMALLRAARRCWDRIGEVAGAGASARAMAQHAVTSPVMMTARDPWVNLLRTTVACVGAGLGGADAVTVLPFDAALGLPDDFSRRIARNTQALLLEESHLAHVIDPAGGSWYVESRTDALAHAAWDVFTGIERDGGIEAVLDDRSLAAAIEATWVARAERVATRREPVTGVSEFPNLHESRPERDPAPAGPGGGLPWRRPAAVFEDLRDRADAAAVGGSRPTAFLATIGPLARWTARASFSTNLLHAGGIDTVDGPGGTDPEATAAAFREAGTTVAVLASTDALYVEHAATVAAALRAAGATRILLAGRPGAADGDATGAGTAGGGGPDVDAHLYAGCDAAALLRDLLDHVGAPAPAAREDQP